MVLIFPVRVVHIHTTLLVVWGIHLVCSTSINKMKPIIRNRTWYIWYVWKYKQNVPSAATDHGDQRRPRPTPPGWLEHEATRHSAHTASQSAGLGSCRASPWRLRTDFCCVWYGASTAGSRFDYIKNSTSSCGHCWKGAGGRIDKPFLFADST